MSLRLTVTEAIAVCLFPLALFLFVLPAGDAAAVRDNSSQSKLLLRGAVHPPAPSVRIAAYSTVDNSVPEPAGAAPDFLPRLKFANYRYDRAPSVQLVSLHRLALPKPARSRHSRRRSGTSVRWRASQRCLPGPLKLALARVAAKYSKVTVNSTHRSRHHNRRVGGAKHSYHLKCQAVDFSVSRNSRAVFAYLRKQSGIGGLKHYGGGVFHIDTGPRRSW